MYALLGLTILSFSKNRIVMGNVFHWDHGKGCNNQYGLLGPNNVTFL